MNTPFINFGALQKIPTPRFELAVAYGTGLWCWFQVPKAASHRQRATGSTLPKSQVTESGMAAAPPLPEPGLQMTSGALFCHHEQVRGCGPRSPLSSQWAAVPTRRDDAICHMSTLSAESPLQSQPYIPTLWIGRSLDVLFQATREDLIPWIGFALRARQTLGLFFSSLSPTLSLSFGTAQLSSPYFYFSYQKRQEDSQDAKLLGHVSRPPETR
ncbi:hypothetical protein TGAM01_v205522 [Trichoderma gamsii]|uniref:Uncharacterized protein n=1 Tax=Trichoderma gamsii TaxID=398673 RepID=A0A2P4ZMW7_9HYPO|nr:hypothetical protein TGAM01_v205522 [Trichoderma gamsii]PON25637.1 hypothetical protein TGAM01_v205522 [Trichoderma gamsii]